MPMTPRARAWQAATRTVLAPLVRQLLREGIRYDEWVRMIEEALVEAAADDGVRTAPALRRLTGLKRVARARSRSDARARPALAYDDGARLLSRWALDSPWGRNGRPRPLPMTGKVSFTALAQAAGVDARKTLAALRRSGLIAMRAGRVHAARDLYIPGGIIEKIDILGRDAAELLRTMIHNIEHRSAGSLLQRKASYDNVGSAALESIRTRLRAEATRVLAGVNKKLARVDRDRNPTAAGGRRLRVSFGVYLLEEPFDGERARTARITRRSRRRS